MNKQVLCTELWQNVPCDMMNVHGIVSSHNFGSDAGQEKYQK